jgi:hypothetical protein
MAASERLDACRERYLALEGIDTLEELVALGGADIDRRALPLLRRRLADVEIDGAAQQVRGYARMAEKSAHLAAGLRAFIGALEEEDDDDRAGDDLDAERGRPAGGGAREGQGHAAAGRGGT